MAKVPSTPLRGRQRANRHQVEGAEKFVPDTNRLSVLAEAARGCRGCDLYRFATQTVFGEGPTAASIMIVGEVPGDIEDLAGHPFVGPAGQLLDKSLHAAGLDRKHVYVTNAVKHFKYELRGKTRLHQKPKAIEIRACAPWLESELDLVRPSVILCLGATAAQALLGAKFLLTKNRGVFQEHSSGASVLASMHPSAILRMPDPVEREQAMKSLTSDLKLAMKRAGKDQ